MRAPGVTSAGAASAAASALAAVVRAQRTVNQKRLPAPSMLSTPMSALKDPGADLGGHADAGVGNLEAELDAAVCERGRPAGDRHRALVGELQRIADEVEEDLPEPGRVADHGGGKVGIEIGEERDALFPRPLAEEVDDLLRLVGRAELGRLEGERPGLEARVVEDVVDDGEEP